MKKKLLVMSLLLLSLVFVGCGNSPETGKPAATSTEKAGNETAGLALELREIGFSPANLRVNDIMLAAIKDSGERIILDKDDRFSIQYAGVVYESDTAKATVKQLEIKGQITNADFSKSGETVGEGLLSAVINIYRVRNVSGENYVEDITYTINTDYNLITEVWAGSKEEIVIMQASSPAKVTGSQDTMGVNGKEAFAVDKEENFNANYYFRVIR